MAQIVYNAVSSETQFSSIKPHLTFKKMAELSERMDIRREGEHKKYIIALSKDQRTYKGYYLFSCDFQCSTDSFRTQFERLLTAIGFKQAFQFASAVHEALANALNANAEVHSLDDICLEFTIRKHFCEVIIVNNGPFDMNNVPVLRDDADFKDFLLYLKDKAEYSRRQTTRTGHYKSGLGFAIIKKGTDETVVQSYQDKKGQDKTRVILRLNNPIPA